MKANNIFKSRRFKHGTFATVMTVVFVAAIVLVNIIATILLEKFPLNIDLTKDQSYAMAEDSKEFLKTVDRDVKITFIGAETDLTGGYYTTAFYDAQALNTMKQCTQYNSKISLEFVDLSKNPQYATKYPDATVSQGSVIVESDLRYKVVQYADMFDVNYDNYYYTGQTEVESSHVESDLMSALMYVTESDPAEIAVLTNNTPKGSEGLQTLLTKNNYSFKEVNLLTQNIPESAEVVLIAAPTTDYTPELIQKLEVYMNNAGKYGKKLVYIASYEQKELPNLEGYLASDWGIRVDPGMVYETDSNNMFMSPYYGLQSLVGEMFTENIESTDEPIMAPGARPLTLTFEASGGTTTTALIKSSETSVIQPIDADKNWDPTAQTPQSYVIGAASTRLKYEEETNKELTSTLVVVSTPDFFIADDSFLNAEYTVEMFNSLAGKEDTALNIIPKHESSDTIEVTVAAASTILVIFVFILPIAIFVTGLIIWFRRRHK
ncbi:MAG: GldG family protein [Oscillospiraceae bacterium]|nr:GldG family protein [Oscillospiraceae bacterium]